jgi:hypothetical protein
LPLIIKRNLYRLSPYGKIAVSDNHGEYPPP